MFRATIALGFLAISVSSVPPSGSSPATPPDHRLAALYDCGLTFPVSGERWQFRGTASVLVVSVTNRTGTHEFTISEPFRGEEIKRLVLTGHEKPPSSERDGYCYVSLGIESMAKVSATLNYRVLHYGNTCPTDSKTIADLTEGRISFPISEPLLSRPASEPVAMMAVSLGKGDAVALTLQDWPGSSEKDPEARVECHTFVHPCFVSSSQRKNTFSHFVAAQRWRRLEE